MWGWNTTIEVIAVILIDNGIEVRGAINAGLIGVNIMLQM